MECMALNRGSISDGKTLELRKAPILYVAIRGSVLCEFCRDSLSPHNRASIEQAKNVRMLNSSFPDIFMKRHAVKQGKNFTCLNFTGPQQI
jgi:hypothetical protein